jgi:small subunit ribosomal protein S18
MAEERFQSSGGGYSDNGAGAQTGPDGSPVRRFSPHFQRFKRKVCRFCTKQISEISWKETDKLTRFTTERGKIMPRRLSGNCAKHQRMLAREIKIARLLALMPFVRD